MGWTDGQPCAFHYCFYWAIKSFWLFFSHPPSTVPQSTDCKHDKRSNICKGKRSGTTVPPSCCGHSCCTRGRVFTWTRTGNHPTPKWIISVIITRLKMNLWTALSHNAIKNNRCWKCLEGTEIKDYFVIPSLLQAQLSCVLSCHPQRGSCGGSFSSGLAVLGARHLTESECCLIWESGPSLSFLDTPCPHNLQLHGVRFY